jgi:cytochrome c-type biogenesis protein CcmF
VRAQPTLAPYVTIVMLGTGAFFSAALAFGSGPFATLAVPPPDGRGLNPLLRNPWMAVHPPALYLGFVGMTVPYALAVAALAARVPGRQWVGIARRWVLLAWLWLTAGLLFGAKWSYVVLGWGGYWAWDPVENAALMPWLTATAVLHSIQAQERRGMLTGWTIALMLLSFGLAIFGTFLTRSGLLSSVHAFANAAIGPYLLGFLALTLTVGFGLLLRRLPDLRTDMAPAEDAPGAPAGPASEPPMESVMSREAALLANNVLLVVGAFVILAGTVFPILAEWVTGDRIAVGPPYFTTAMTPVIGVLLILMAAGPLLPWRGGRGDEAARRLALPGAVAVLGAGTAAAVGVRTGGVLTILLLCIFVAAAVVVEIRAGLAEQRADRPAAGAGLLRLIAGNRRRYGGYTAHLGLVVLLAAATVSGAFATTAQGTVGPGETLRVGAYDVRYDGARRYRGPGLRLTEAAVTVRRGDTVLPVLRPRHVVHEERDEVTADVAIRSTWRDDLYIVLMGISTDGRATFRISVNPMLPWLWLGALLMLAGGITAALPRRRARALSTTEHAEHRVAEQPAPVAGGDR